MKASDDPRDADVFDFVAEYLDDVELGRERQLSDYLARWPASQEAIAREYVSLRGGSAGDDARPPESDAAIGDRRLGAYRIERELGRGGQGVVYLAWDVRLGRRVALKVLSSSFDSISADKLRRFRREAEAIARLEHPCLCTIYEADLDAPTPWIAMRFIEGRTLADVLAEARAARAAGDEESGRANLEQLPQSDVPRFATRFPPASTLELFSVLHFFERAARALHAAHEAGVIHRDVKPGNVIVASDGRPVLLDFGLARNEGEDDGSVTRSGELFGTPAYMSPEQLELGSDELDRRTDVYSLGVALYEALTLDRPFEAAARAALYGAIRSEPPPDPRRKNPALGEDVKVVLETALEKSRERRYATALDFAEDLRRIREYEPIRARPAGVALRFARWTRRHPALAVSIIGTIAALSIGLAVSLELLANVREALVKERAALSVALGNHLAQRAQTVIDEDPSRALLLGIEAVERAPSYLTRSVLIQALDACWLERTLQGSDLAKRCNDFALAPGGGAALAAFDDGDVIAFELASGARRFTTSLPRPATHAVWSAQGDLVALGDDEGALVVLDARDGSTLARHSGPATADERARAAVASLDFDPSGASLALRRADGRLELRASRDLAQRWSSAFGGGAHAQFTPDGARLVAQDGLGGVRVLDACDGRETERLSTGGAARWIDTAQRDGAELVAVVDEDGRVVVATLRASNEARASDEATASVDATSAPLADVAPAASADRLSTHEASFDERSPNEGAPREHSSNAGSAVEEAARARIDRATSTQLFDVPAALSWCAFSPDASRLALVATRGDEGEAWILDVGSGARTKLAGHDGRAISRAAFSPDGARLATAGLDSTVRVWDASSGAQIVRATLPWQHLDLAWSADGARIVTRSNGAYLHVWFGAGRGDTLALVGHSGAVRAARIATASGLALTAGDDGTARVWTTRADASGTAGRELARVQSSSPLVDARFSAAGDAFATFASDGVARAWRARDGAPLGPPLVHEAAIVAADFASRGDRVATIDARGRARVSDALGGGSRTLDCEGANAACIRFSPDGARVAVGAQDDVARVFDAASGALVNQSTFARRDAQRGGIVDLAFHPTRDELALACGDLRLRFVAGDGSQARAAMKIFQFKHVDYSADGSGALVVGTWGGGAVRWIDLASGAANFPQNRHTGSIASASVSADGRFVCTASVDGSVSVWNAQGGAPVAMRADFGAAVLCAAFEGDDASLRVLCACENGRVLLWPVDPLRHALARRPRALTDWERRREAELAAPLTFE